MPISHEPGKTTWGPKVFNIHLPTSVERCPTWMALTQPEPMDAVLCFLVDWARVWSTGRLRSKRDRNEFWKLWCQQFLALKLHFCKRCHHLQINDSLSSCLCLSVAKCKSKWTTCENEQYTIASKSHVRCKLREHSVMECHNCVRVTACSRFSLSGGFPTAFGLI